MTDKKIPELDRCIFWDVDFNYLDYDRHARFIIERVFDRGDVNDIRQCRRYYGDEKISGILLNARFLSEVRTYLAAAVINKPVEDFRCYKIRQLMPGLFPY
ncbi:MAG: hypothetical protein LBC98_02660 [Prevotellaceae bacterium]|jgi:hypothetical protein|nr:hypothetical protein [Prevotellaceae bacterium]